MELNYNGLGAGMVLMDRFRRRNRSEISSLQAFAHPLGRNLDYGVGLCRMKR